jgi:uncharacterized protein with PIN domain
MKKLLVTALSMFLVMTLITACQPGKEKAEKNEPSESMDSTSNEQMAKVQYTCSMHPEVLQDEPGKCSKCGMELVKKETKDDDMKDMPMDSTENK